MATVNNLDALFKQVYGDSEVNAVPDFAKLQEHIPFSPQEKLGDEYVVPVVLSHEHGFSYGADGDGAFTLNAAVAGTRQKAKLPGNQIVLRSQLSYEDVSKAAAKGDQAFRSATEAVVENMLNSFRKRLELSFLYGQQGLGQVESNSPAGTIVISASSWAPGIWSGMKDCVLEAFDSQSSTASQHNGDLVVSAVNMDTRTITVTGTSSSVVQNDHLYFKSARTTTAHKECAGVDKIITNTSTFANINAGTYELWKGQSYSVSGQLSLQKILEACSKAVNMGLMEDAKVYVSPSKWTKLASDEAALRRYNNVARKAENGSEELEYLSTNGKISIVAHPMVKEGEGFLLANPAKRVKRIGASDITFKRPGGEDKIFRELESNAGFELRAFADQAIFIEKPAHCVKLTDIT